MPSISARPRTRSNPERSSSASSERTQYCNVPRRICASRASCVATMHYKVPAITSYVNEHAAGFCLHLVDGHPHGVVIETPARGRIELPPMPRTAEDGLAAELVAPGLA